MFSWLLILNATVTFAMTGIIWFVHLVHYPVITAAPEPTVVALETLHWKRTMPLAIAMLTLEIVTGSAMVFLAPTELRSAAMLGLLLIVFIWITTWQVCVPAHRGLKEQCSVPTIHTLMKANSFRALLWLLRSGVTVYMLVLAIQ